jgi:hypothetical protein
MASKFPCHKCYSEIVVRHLQIGEVARCKNCGADNRVPVDALVVADSLTQATATAPVTDLPTTIAETDAVAISSFKGQRAWNPTGIFWLGMVFSVLPAGILWALNFEKLGQPSRKKSSFVMVGLYSLLVLIMSVLPKVSLIITTPVNIAICWTYYTSQSTLFRDFLTQGGQERSFRRPIAFSLVVIILVLTCIFAYAYLG